MTMHDDSNLQLLERDLQALAKEQENDEDDQNCLYHGSLRGEMG